VCEALFEPRRLVTCSSPLLGRAKTATSTFPARRGSWLDVSALDDMTSDDHNQVMSKVGIADLKAHLSEHLRRVRRGRTITVVDRGTPVAQIVPYDVAQALEIRRATRKPGELHLPSPLANATDSLSVLLEDRASR
jgi:prevent-host-death family protein